MNLAGLGCSKDGGRVYRAGSPAVTAPRRCAGPLTRWLLLLALGAAQAAPAATYEATFGLEFSAGAKQARGSLTLGRGAQRVRWIDFQLGPAYTKVEADGTLEVKDGRALWTPPPEGGTFSYHVRIEQERKSGGYRSRYADDWAVFRGDRVFPPARVRTAKGAKSRSRLVFKMPAGWHASAPYLPDEDGGFIVDGAERRFDRPVGWMMVGRLGTRSDVIADTKVVIAAPRNERARRMDMMVFLSYTLPAMDEAFGKLPPKILIVGAPDPMWRGGLSAPRSLYLHLERPLVSGNGTSSLLHELTHVITRIRGADSGDDWIAEGLAEFYAVDILRRTGGMTAARLDKVKAALKKWGGGVESLRVARSSGPVTARAALLLLALDREIRRRTDGQAGVDDVTRALMPKRKVSTAEFIRTAERVAGGALHTLDTPLLASP